MPKLNPTQRRRRISAAVQTAVAAAMAATGYDPLNLERELDDEYGLGDPAIAELRSLDFGAADVQVDEGSGLIRNCAVMTVGPTLGHPFSLDGTSLLQAQKLINGQQDGVKVRFKHPGAVKTPDGAVIMADDAGSVVGRLLPTTRIVGDCLRGDVQIGQYAASLPGQGDARAYLMGIAKDDPQNIGLSIVMAWTPDRGADGSIVARVTSVMACDFVGKPAANPNGLLAARTFNDPARGVLLDASRSESQQTADGLAARGGVHLAGEVAKPFESAQTIIPSGARAPREPLTTHQSSLQQGPAQTRPRKAILMDPKLKAHLVAMGMDPDASDEAAMAFHAGLSQTAKSQLAAKCACGAAPGAPPTAATDDEPKAKKKPAPAAELDAEDSDGGDAPMSARQPEKNIVALEARRVNDLEQLGAVLKVPKETIRGQIAAGADAATARVAFLSAVAAENQPIAGAIGSIHVGRDANQVAMMQAIPEGIALRAGYATIAKPHELAPKLAGLSIIDMGRQWLAMLGAADVTYIPRVRMVELLMSRRELRKDMPQVAMLAESVGDFPSLLLDAINKTFRPLYQDAPKTWPVWVRRTSAADFKNINRVALSEAGSLKRRDEGGQINYVLVTDGKEVYALAEYVGGIKITRKGMINDDLDGFGRIPQLQANSAWRCEEETVYGVLTANAALGVDNVALFNSAHGNLISAGGAAPNVTSMTATEALMLRQKGPGGKARLALDPKFVITPVSLKRPTQQFLTSTDLISVISTSSAAPQTVGSKNPYAGNSLTHIYTPVLDDTSTTAWYLAADYRKGQVDTVEIAFLDGEPEPVLRQETDFDTEDVKFAVRHTLASKAIDFRGLVYNPGQ